MIVGHTKFDVDRAFAVTAKAYASADVFTTEELGSIMSSSPLISALVDNGSRVRPWRDKLSTKYNKMPGIRTIHDVIIVPNSSSRNDRPVMLVRDLCYTGVTRPSTIQVRDSEDIVSFTEEENYVTEGKIRTISSTKLDHLKQMYSKFIPIDRRIRVLLDS